MNMTSGFSKRLGKRSLLRTRIGAADPLGDDGNLMPGPAQAELCRRVSGKDGKPREYPEDGLVGPGFQSLSGFKLYPGQKVYVTWDGRECAGVVEQHNHVDDEVTVLMQEEGLRTCRKVEDVHLPETPRSQDGHPHQSELTAQSSGLTSPRLVSCNIDVPKRCSEAVEMDKMMAAMVLSSLSGSPGIQSPLQVESLSAPAPCGLWKDSGDVSDSGISTTSGNSTPSPTHSDDGFDTDPDYLLLDEPAPRKRKNSVKVLYKCLWPHCGKLLRSTVGIKRHIRTQHLRHSPDSEEHKHEEDFYYTETKLEVASAMDCSGPTPRCLPPAVVFPRQQPDWQASAGPEAQVPEQPGSEASLFQSLAQSAPSSFWHIQTDHAYQVSPPRSCSVSVGEYWQPQHTVQSKYHPASPPRGPGGTRKVRGEAKKCRKVYGIERRDQWCTACRWKKACQRFLD
ncbi:zinc finger protein 395a isoform X2 [Latimeria chalumnae]|uniref:zinc finger protein 395a isoform X2 n=1 Tax=Latimeria chalumnae TaxID=7897 RepID=UPI00313B3667